MFIINFCLNMFRASLCPKHVETEVDNKHLIVASCWFSLSSHFAHDVRSQEPKAYKYIILKCLLISPLYVLTTRIIIIIIIREAVYCSAIGISKMYVTLYVSYKKINYVHVFR